MSLTCDYTDFGAPFDHLDADLILRSAPVLTSASVGTLGEDRSTATDFRVHKLFLIKASPVFERLLCEPSSSGSDHQPEAAELGITRDDNDNGSWGRDRDLPVLRLTEDRDTLHRLLTAIYPTEVVYPQTLEVMMRTFAAARKYGMSSVLALFRTYCDRVARIVTTDNAFRAYLFAFGEGLCEEALEAAHLTLSQPQTFESYGEDLRQASGPALKALWKHRQFAFVAIGFGVQDCVVEVGDLRGWKATGCSLRVGDKSCCTEMGTRPLEQFMLYTRKITSNFAMMNFPSFVEAMSSQGGFKCASCKAPIRLNLLRLFNCLERHVNVNFSRASPTSSVFCNRPMSSRSLDGGLPDAGEILVALRRLGGSSNRSSTV
jgi:BTB/POZ domain